MSEPFRIPNPEEWASRADRVELNQGVTLVVAEWIERRKPAVSVAREVCAKYGVHARFDVTRCGQDVDFERINVTTRNNRCLGARVG